MGEASSLFHEITEKATTPSLIGEALYWSGRNAESGKDRDKSRCYYKKLYETLPDSTFAAEAYFRMYDYFDYLQGEREAIKHLEIFSERYPDSPFLLNALYIMGLDAKRDRKTSSGKWIGKKDRIKAIEHFGRIENLYKEFLARNTFSEEEKKHYSLLRFHAVLERASANLNLGTDASGAKRQIYLKYAEEVFTSFLSEVTSELSKEDSRTLEIEGRLGLARTFLASDRDKDAEEVLVKIVTDREDGKNPGKYHLSRVLNLLGKIESLRKNYTKALQRFTEAEEISGENPVTTDRKLEQWIEMSDCYRELKEYDRAMTLLSKVINEDAISGLRIKAMLLRANIYSLQERHELAKKQLEACSLKGGEWGKKAKEQLMEMYGY